MSDESPAQQNADALKAIGGLTYDVIQLRKAHKRLKVAVLGLFVLLACSWLYLAGVYYGLLGFPPNAAIGIPRRSGAQSVASALPTAHPINQTPQTVSAANQSEEYRQFIRESRRLVSAINAGLTPDDMGQRLIEITASAEEASRTVTDSEIKVNIKTFVETLTDALWLWRLGVSIGERPGVLNGIIDIPMVNGKLSYADVISQIPQSLRTYNLDHIQEFADKYKISSFFFESSRGSYWKSFDTRGALQPLFSIAIETFHSLDGASDRL